MRVERLQREFGVDVEWKPFELHPDIPPEGKHRRTERPDYEIATRNLRRMADEVGLPLHFTAVVSNSRLALEASEFAKDRGRFDQFHRDVFRAYFEKELNIGLVEVLLDIAREVQLDSQELKLALENRTYRDRVQEQVDHAHSLGITGAPTFFIGTRVIVGLQPYQVFRQAVIDAQSAHRP